MTRDRIYGNDVEFMAWVRNQDRLPSFSPTVGFVTTDCDCFIHRYMSCVDVMGTREVQALMFLEIKTRGGDLRASQQDTLEKVNRFQGVITDKQGLLRSFGVSVVKLSGTSPDDSDFIQWGRFNSGQLNYTTINKETLIQLMLFELHADNLTPQPFRRHHKTREINVVETTTLGFTVERPYKRSS